MSVVIIAGLKRPVIRVGPDGGAVREAALGRLRDAGRRLAAELPRRPRQPQPVHGGRPRAGSRADAARLRARGAHAELRALADRRRLRRPAPSRELGPAPSSASRPSRTSIARWCDAWPTGSTSSSRSRAPRSTMRDASSSSLARGPALCVRAGADALPAASRELVQPDDALSVDRRAHGGARRRARRVLPRHRESDRCQDRAGHDAQRASSSAGDAQSDQRAGPADADSPLRRRARGRQAAGAHRDRADGRGNGAVDVRSRCTATRRC